MAWLADRKGLGTVVSRRIVLGLAFAPLLGPIARSAHSQPRGSMPRLALLCAVWCQSMQTGRHEEGQAFVEALRVLGHVDGQTVVLDERGAAVTAGLANVTAELVRRNVTVILADGLPAAQAAMKATTTIPIVMVGVGDPVRHQVVRSLARPGGNVTGVAVPFTDLVRKQLGLLREAVGQIRRVGVLWNPDNPSHAPTLAAVEDAGRAAGVEVRLVQARSETHTELEGVFSALDRDGIRGLLVLGDSKLTGGNLHLFAIRHRIATVSMRRPFAQGGGLMAYGPHRFDIVQRAAYFVDRILRGTKPGELPVEEPTRYELTVNVTTAKALGLTLPQSILGRADEIMR